MIFKLGRMGNLLLYLGLVYWALHHISQGKKVIFTLALMPVSMITATTYSYDAWVNGFAFLGMAYLLEEWMDIERKVSVRNYLIGMAALMLSSFPKAIYCPFLLLFLLFPVSRFKNPRESYILRGTAVIAFVLMAGTFMLPALSSSSQMGGDKRGGNTSVSGQLQYIFAHPLFYAKLLINNIQKTLLSYAVGVEGLGQMGHFTNTASPYLTVFGITQAVLTDSCTEETKRMPGWKKVSICIISFGVLCLIWTALYLSFTSVGLNQINGVQGRYYIPVTMWIFWALRPDKFLNYRKKSIDHILIAATSLLILLPLVYQNIVVNTF